MSIGQLQIADDPKHQSDPYQRLDILIEPIQDKPKRLLGQFDIVEAVVLSHLTAEYRFGSPQSIAHGPQPRQLPLGHQVVRRAEPVHNGKDQTNNHRQQRAVLPTYRQRNNERGAVGTKENHEDDQVEGSVDRAEFAQVVENRGEMDGGDEESECGCEHFR